MNSQKNRINTLFPAILIFVLSACSSLTLDQVDFGWPVESVITVNRNNSISEGRYAISMNVAPIAYEEFQDSTALQGTPVRLLRNNEGLYFITGPRFKHVYVFSPATGRLKMSAKIPVTETGLRNPALNQRTPYIELIDEGSPSILLTSNEKVEARGK